MKYDLMSHEISKQNKKRLCPPKSLLILIMFFIQKFCLRHQMNRQRRVVAILTCRFFPPVAQTSLSKPFIYIFPPKRNSFGQTHRKDFAFGLMGTPAVMTVLTPPVAETQTSASSSRRFGIVWRLQISARYMPFSISGGNGDRGGRGGGGIPGMKAGRVPGYQGSLAAAVAAATSTVSTTTLVRARPSELAQTKLNRFVFLAAGGASMALAFV